MLNIHEIYASVQGESTLAGMPCVFVRLAGCPLRCSYCDTEQAIPFDSGRAMSLDDIVQQVQAFGHRLVLVTGGEPLAQKNAIPLLQSLCASMPIVQLETSGALDVSQVPEKVCKIMDIKTPESGEYRRHRWSNMQYLTEQDEIKLVLSSRADYVWARDEIMPKLQDIPSFILFSAVWGALPLRDLAAWILHDHLEVRLQVQMHKVIWGAEQTGV